MASYTPALPIGIASTSMTAGSESFGRVPFVNLRRSGVGASSAPAGEVVR
ncbi:hypothetical protein [Parasphingorhabdus sp.]